MTEQTNSSRMYMLVRGKVVGPYSADEMETFRKQGHLTPDIPVWAESDATPQSVLDALSRQSALSTESSSARQQHRHSNAPDPAYLQRFVAAIIDGILIGIIGSILQFVLRGGILAMLAGMIAGFVYEFHFLRQPKMATPGKMIMKLQVCNATTGQALTDKEVVTRIVVKDLLWLTLGIGYLMIFFTKRHQGLHDLAAESVVVPVK